MKRTIGVFFSYVLILLLVLAYSGCISSPYTTKVNIAVNPNECHAKNIKIAVIPFDTSGYKGFDAGPNIGENIADQYTLEFIKIGYNVVERTRLTKILKEQGIHMTGIVDPNDAVKAGNILGVHAMVFGNVVGQPNMWGLTMRMVAVKTGIILWSANSNLRPVVPALLATELHKELLKQKKCN